MAWASAAGFVLFGAGVWWAYREFVHYEQLAAAHLPAGAELRVELNCEHVIAFDPLRKHLLPLLELWIGGRNGDSKARLPALREEAGLNLGADLREVALARDGESWLIALGGLFPERGLIDGVERVLASTGIDGLARSGAQLMLGTPRALLTQAEDGVLLVASDRQTLVPAVSPRAPAARTSRAEPVFAEVRLKDPGALALAAPDWLSSVEHITVTSRLSRGLELDLALRLRSPADLDTTRAALEAWLSAPGDLTGWSGAGAALAHAKLAGGDEKSIIVSTYLTVSELDHAARELGEWLRQRLETGVRPSSSGTGVLP